MADDNSGLMAEFEEFLKVKQEKESTEAADEDFELEIFNKDGEGVRTRRSHAKPFLQRMGIDLDPDPEPEPDPGPAKKAPPKGKQAASTPASGVARKYFVKKV